MKKGGIVLFTLALSILTATGLTTIVDASTEIPAWVKGVADFWLNGKISDQEFLDAIRFLVEKGILKIELVESLKQQVRELENEIAVILLESQESLSKQPTLIETEPDATPITLIAKHPERVHLQKSYTFLIRVYDAKENPKDNFYQNWGYLSNVNVTATIFGSDGNVVRSFSGLTNNFGYFSDGFFVPSNFRVGTYTTQIMAEKDGALSDAELMFHVMELPDDVTTPPP